MAACDIFDLFGTELDPYPHSPYLMLTLLEALVTNLYIYASTVLAFLHFQSTTKVTRMLSQISRKYMGYAFYMPYVKMPTECLFSIGAYPHYVRSI